MYDTSIMTPDSSTCPYLGLKCHAPMVGRLSSRSANTRNSGFNVDHRLHMLSSPRAPNVSHPSDNRHYGMISSILPGNSLVCTPKRSPDWQTGGWRRGKASTCSRLRLSISNAGCNSSMSAVRPTLCRECGLAEAYGR